MNPIQMNNKSSNKLSDQSHIKKLYKYREVYKNWIKSRLSKFSKFLKINLMIKVIGIRYNRLIFSLEGKACKALKNGIILGIKGKKKFKNI